MTDKPPRRLLLSRRAAIARLGAVALAAAPFATVRGAAPAGCVLTPEQTEGPFFLDTRQERADLRTDPTDGNVRDGVPLALVLRVQRYSGGACSPLAGAVVDVWHCDAAGEYSGTAGGQRFLRGYQITDGEGVVRFTTIYPGWYPGRAVHIHVKVRSGTRELTSQLYFDDALSDRVFARTPYAREGRGKLRNEQDGLYRDRGRQLTLSPVAQDAGFAAAFDLGMKLG